MNLFLLDKNPFKAAEFNFDPHVRKIILESSIMIGYAFINQNLYFPLNWIRKDRHSNHPMAKVVREGEQNFWWCFDYLKGLLHEFEYRFEKKHAYSWVPTSILKSKIPQFQNEFLEWPRCFGAFKGSIPKTNSVVDDYRNYYIIGKQHLKKYTRRKVPDWFKIPISNENFAK